MAAGWACKAFGREPLCSLTRSVPIAKTGSLNAASPRVTAAICLRSYLLRGAERDPTSGGAQTPDKWQCVQWLSGVLAASPQKKNVREESISCEKGIRANLSGCLLVLTMERWRGIGCRCRGCSLKTKIHCIVVTGVANDGSGVTKIVLLHGGKKRSKTDDLEWLFLLRFSLEKVPLMSVKYNHLLFHYAQAPC